MRTAAAMLKIVWASPWTLFGLLIGSIGLLTGARVQRTGRVLEFWGGGAETFLRIFPWVAGASAVTFGHVVLARNQDCLESCRLHELVHVRQYERWGPLFVPVYLFFWAILWLVGRHPYLDNPFERQAFEEAP
jgi:hypothetical protein